MSVLTAVPSVVVTLSPNLKRQAITAGLSQMSINSTYHQGWNLRIQPDFMEVNARQLNSPQLSYRNNKGQPQIVNTQDGAWMTKNLRAYRAGIKVTRWIVVVFAVSLGQFYLKSRSKTLADAPHLPGGSPWQSSDLGWVSPVEPLRK